MEQNRKLLVATLVLTEAFRLLDVTKNWGFLSTHSSYITFLAVDLVFIVLGLPALMLFRSPSSYARTVSGLYAIFGLGLTLLDPDFSHFVSEPIQFIEMEVPATLLFTVGLGTLSIMLVLSVIRLPRKDNETVGHADVS